MNYIRLGAALALMTVLFAPAAAAQDQATVRVTRATVVLEEPRGDSVRVTTVQQGAALEVLGHQGKWYLVTTAETPAGKDTWQRGWIHVDSIEGAGVRAATQKAARPGRTLIRAFGHGGGTLFDARNSFETIVGRTVGSVYGAGGQIVFRNGAFAQVSVDRFEETGSRALVSGTQIFTLESPARITVRPILATGGYRASSYGRVAPYAGAGIGWHRLTEESASSTGIEKVNEAKLGYHVVGGAEYSLARWLGVAGEVQWTTVPKLLGDAGVSAIFQEDDLGGTTFRFKVIVGY